MWLVTVDARTFEEWWSDASMVVPVVCVECGGPWMRVQRWDGEEWIGSDDDGSYVEGYSMCLFCDSDDCDGLFEVELITRRAGGN